MKADFIYGTQYYRAPTPAREYWADDLKHIRELGFDSVKFWVQWRWSGRIRGEFYWDDLDELMDLAHANGLKVTLNLITEVAPAWVFREWPDSVMVRADGIRCESTANICRQIGGYPGPCYSHDDARKAKYEFIAETVRHFRTHPALAMWDVWNEPECNLMLRKPELSTMLCYCPSCEREFLSFLRQKYGSPEKLNQVWGRCYTDWEEIELPRQTQTITDFIDWRLFHLQKLTAEAEWKLKLVKELDPERIVYLHVVPDTAGEFNCITCVDDFALADCDSDVFGSTMTPSPLHCAQAVSASGDKLFYNAEWHVNFGSINMPQRVLERDRFYYELLPQLGWGVKGILYWQFRSETLGSESPAWGVVRCDGAERPVTEYVSEFIAHIAPFRERLLAAKPFPAEIAVIRDCENEIFRFCADNNDLGKFHDDLQGITDTLYKLNLPFRMINFKRLAAAPDKVRMLILPGAYLLSQENADILQKFVQRGGVLFVDGHLGAYNFSTGRHSTVVPGMGFPERFGFYEKEVYSTWHLPGEAAGEGIDSGSDAGKAAAAADVCGSGFSVIATADGITGKAADRVADVHGENIEHLAGNKYCSCAVRAGNVFYTGTTLGRGALQNDRLLAALLQQAADAAGIKGLAANTGIHVDFLGGSAEQPEFIVLNNPGADVCSIVPEIKGRYINITSGAVIDDISAAEIVLQPESAVLLVLERMDEK